MAKFIFSPEDLRRGFGLARLIKPATGDFILKFMSGLLVVYSADKRKFCRIQIRPSFVSDEVSSDDYYLSIDRTTLFDTDLDTISVSLTDKGLIVRSEGNGQSRQAFIKKRLDSSRRATVPNRQEFAGTAIKTKQFEQLLNEVSCSALVKETKTDEDMKVNQVHFYPGDGCAVSNARFYASVVYLEGLSLDLSIISSDIPTIRSFCSKIASDEVIIGQTKSHLIISDPLSGSYAFFSRVACNRPPLSVLPDNGYAIELCVDSAKLSKSLSWSSMAIDGTSRLTLHIDKDQDGNCLVMTSSGQELSRIPAELRSGNEFCADFPVRILANLADYVDSGKTLLRYRHKNLPTILEVCGDSTSGPVRARHFVQSMKERS